MTEQEIYDKIAKIISERFDISSDKINMDLNFQNDLNADSIDIVEFILELEDVFGSEISDDIAEKIATVRDAVKYINDNQ